MLYTYRRNMEIPAIIIKKGTYCLTQHLTEKQQKYIKSTFTIRNKNIMGYFDIIKCYSYKKASGRECLLLPRFANLYLNKINLKIKNEIQDGTAIDCNTTARFAGNQKLVFDEIFKSYYNYTNVKAGMAGVIINLEAGQGKTFLALHVIAKLKKKTFIFVHNELILNQWIKVVTEFMTGARIGKWYGRAKIDGDIIIGIINSADTYDGWDSIGLCIFDEAHLYCSPKRSEIFKMCQATYMMGLSATPDERKERQDNTYKIIQWQIGPILTANQLPNFVESITPFTARVQMIKYRGPPEHTQTLVNETVGMVSNPKMLQQLTEDTYRINLIVQQTIRIIQDRNVNLFIFASRRSYLLSIHQKLLDVGIVAVVEAVADADVAVADADVAVADADVAVADADVAVADADDVAATISTIMGQSTPEAVEIAETKSKIILTTYQYFGTGKSIPRMNAMILAMPFKTNSKQYINRIFRLGSDHTIVREIIDIVDWSTTLKSQWYWRRKYYLSKNYPITMTEVKWTNV